jgi:uncharacterized membrane protein YqjE
MVPTYAAETFDRNMSVHSILSRISVLVQAFVDRRAAVMTALWRNELRRFGIVIASALMMSFFVCAAAALAILSIVLAFWDTHRVLAVAAVALGCVICAAASLLVLRNFTRTERQGG